MVGRTDYNDSARDWELFCELSNLYSDYNFFAVSTAIKKVDRKRYTSVNFTGNLEEKQLIDMLSKSNVICN